MLEQLLVLGRQFGEQSPPHIIWLAGRKTVLFVPFDNLLFENVGFGVEIRFLARSDVWQGLLIDLIETEPRVDVRIVIGVDSLIDWIGFGACQFRPDDVPEDVPALLHLLCSVDLHHQV